MPDKAAEIPADDLKRHLKIAQPDQVRLLCICSPSGQEKFFEEVGVPVATRTTAPPQLGEKQQAEFKEKAKALAPKYRTEFLKEA